MRIARTVLSVALVAVVITSCGQGGDDSGACKGFTERAVPELLSVTDFAENWREREGSYEGMIAASEAGGGMQEVSYAATAAAKVASKKGKKLFEKVAESFKTAAYAIPIRGGSVGSYESELMIQVLDDFSNLTDYCNGDDSGGGGG